MNPRVSIGTVSGEWSTSPRPSRLTLTPNADHTAWSSSGFPVSKVVAEKSTLRRTAKVFNTSGESISGSVVTKTDATSQWHSACTRFWTSVTTWNMTGQTSGQEV